MRNPDSQEKCPRSKEIARCIHRLALYFALAEKDSMIRDTAALKIH
jgi:hypothetical protein